MDYYYTYYFIKECQKWIIRFLNMIQQLSTFYPGIKSAATILLGKTVISLQVSSRQAFKTAGDCFNVIEDKGIIDIVVVCDRRSKRLINEMNSNITLGQQFKILRQLQIYSVSISELMKDSLAHQNALYQLKMAVL